MLYNNEECEWSDFARNPLEIPSSSLSRHLIVLTNEGYITRITKGHYKITSEGRKRFHELSKADITTRRLNYPPVTIIKSGRNYGDWILWMAYNNTYCKWSDFLNEPLSINQSSLSKEMNLMIKNGFIRKDQETKEYSITHSGKLEYSKMLQNYDLDRQTILDEESKRIENIAKKTIKFFEKFKIEDTRTQFRFLNNILKLDYERVKPMLKNEENFHKILYFLSLNHPNQYPLYISPKEFSTKFGIKENMLTYYLDEIVQNNIYPIKFFELEISNDKHYYFQENEKLETMIRAITEDYITEFTYLNKLFSRKLDISHIIDNISNEICEFLLNKDLLNALKIFLPDYINHLAYKTEAERKLIESYDKLEGLIWQNISSIVKARVIENDDNQYRQYLEEINKNIESNPDNIELYYSKVQLMINTGEFDKAFSYLDEMITRFPKNEKDIKMKKASLLKKNGEIKAGFDIICDLLEKSPKDNELLVYKAYWLQYLNKKEESYEVIHSLIKKNPNKGFYHDTYGEILMYFEEYQKAINEFQKAIELGIEDWYIHQTFIKLGICYKEMGNMALAVEFLRKGKESNDNRKWIAIADIFLTEMEDFET
jgi:tetratricopeptide (TPR) repeat protein/DNA-binding HxlR family transcriptional regulator